MSSSAEWSCPSFVPMLWVAGVATTIGYAFGVMAVPRIGSRVASFVGLSEVLFALGFAWLLLGEVPAPIQFVGGALILVGVVLVRADAGDCRERRRDLLLRLCQLHERRHAIADHFAHRERGLGALDAVDREDAGIRSKRWCASRHTTRTSRSTCPLSPCAWMTSGMRAISAGCAEALPGARGADERLDRIAERRRGDAAFEREEDTGWLEARHARLHRVAREPETLGERDDGGPRVAESAASSSKSNRSRALIAPNDSTPIPAHVGQHAQRIHNT